MLLGRFFHMVGCVGMVPVSQVCMMGCRRNIALAVGFRRSAMVLCSHFVMFCRLGVMIR